MKRLAPCLLTVCLVLTAAPLTAKDSQPQFNTIVVKHFVNANGVNQSQEFIQEFSESLCTGLRGWKIAAQVVQEEATVSDADSANSLEVEGKFTSLDKGVVHTRLHMEINIYRISDHVLVKTISTHEEYGIHGAGSGPGGPTAVTPAFEIRTALKKVDLSSIPAGPPVPRPTAHAPASATATPAPLALASIQFSSTPTGAEITIDGAYAGNTPSLIKLRPGTHSIRIAKDGYTPWERTIEPGAGESRTAAATLEKTTP